MHTKSRAERKLENERVRNINAGNEWRKKHKWKK